MLQCQVATFLAMTDESLRRHTHSSASDAAQNDSGLRYPIGIADGMLNGMGV